MKDLRLWTACFFAWVFLLYNIERLHKPINLASFVYVVAALIAVALLVITRLQRLPLWWLVVIPVPFVLALKTRLGYPIAGEHLPLTVTELGAIGITTAFAWRLGQRLNEASRSVASTLVGHRRRSRPFADGQAEMYREIRRARAFQRRLALLAVAPESSNDRAAIDRFLAEMERQTVQEFVSVRIADLLASHLKDYDIVVRRDGHFLTLLPEVDREQAAAIAETLAESAKKKLGLDLKIGMSVFPEEEVTLVGLLDRAENALRRGEENGHKSHNGHAAAGREGGKAAGEGNGRHGPNRETNQPEPVSAPAEAHEGEA